MIKILFVCHGNICRSPMAEFVLKDMTRRTGTEAEFEIDSAAVSSEELGNPVYPPARRKLAQHGIDCSGKTARRITREDYDRFDLIIGMDEDNLVRMSRTFGGDPDGKFHTLLEYADRAGESVADPWYTGDFDSTWDDVYEGCFGLLRSLAGEIKLDFSRCKDRQDIFAEMRAKMLWQDWYGETLDALFDILTGLPYIGRSFCVTMPAEDAPESCIQYAARVCGIFEIAGVPVRLSE